MVVVYGVVCLLMGDGWLWLLLGVSVAASSCTRCCTTVLLGVLSGFDGVYTDLWDLG